MRHSVPFIRGAFGAHRVSPGRTPPLSGPALVAWLFALVAVAACTSPRQTLPPRPDSGAGGTGGKASGTGGMRGLEPTGTGGCGGDSTAACTTLGPTCEGASCDGGGAETPPGPADGQPDAGYPTACPGGVKAYWDLPADVSALDFSPDGAFLASGARDGTVMVHKTADATEFARHARHRQGILAVRFSHSGLMLAAGSEDGSATLWNVGPQPPRPWVHGSFVYSVAFTADDVNMAVGGQRGVYMIRTATLAAALRLETQLYNRSVAFMPGDAELLVASGETAGQLLVLKSADLSLVRMVAQHLEPIPRVAIPPRNATHLVYANGNFLRTVIIATNAIFPFDQHIKPIEDVRYSNDATHVVTSAPDATRVWLAGEWRVEQSFGPSPAVAFSPDGKRLARAEGRRVLVHCLSSE
jgi:WD40 repeat protein